MKTWHFGSNNDNLVNLVLKGEKRATTYLFKEYLDEKEELPKVGSTSILLFNNEKKACVTRVTNVLVTEFKNINERHAYLEGEGDKSLEYYQKVHKDIFSKIDENFDDDSLVVFEEFEVVEDLTKKRLEYASKIVLANQDIFGNMKHDITEINAGFNNDIFDIDNKYIIKACTNIELEFKFENEYNFYVNNSNFDFIPKLYKYENNKKNLGHIYEIIEKIEGKSLYYYYYKMNEKEKEDIIKKIVLMLKSIHKEVKSDIDFSKYIKGEVLKYFNKTKKYFSNEEQKIILNSLNKYDEYLSDNHFSLIHNDLHFDNIIMSNDKLYLIDFNDSCIMPFDYDLRILYMCKETPWKWANIEMDPYQKKEDYQTIYEYIKKYYTEFSKIKYIDERMKIYRVLNDIELLVNYNKKDLKENIINYSKEILKDE